MAWIVIGATALTIGSQFVINNQQQKANARGANLAQQAEEDLLDAQIQWEKDQKVEIQEALDNFNYNFDPTNPFNSLTNTFENVTNQYENLSNSFSNLTNEYADLENRFAGQNNAYEGLTDTYEGIENPYGGLENPYSGLDNSFENVNNTFAGQQVAQESIDFQQEQSNQQLANITDSIQEGGGFTASSATALARQAGQATRQLGGQIEQQEIANQQRFNQAEFQRQTNIAQGAQTLGLAGAGAQQQLNLSTAGAQQQLNLTRAQATSRRQELVAGAENQINQLEARGQTTIDLAQAQQGQQNLLLEAQQNQQNELLSAQGQTTIDIAGAQQENQNQLAEAQGEQFVQQQQEDREATRLELAAGGFNFDPSGNANGISNEQIGRTTDQANWDDYDFGGWRNGGGSRGNSGPLPGENYSSDYEFRY